MSFGGFPKAAQRADVVDYLNSLSDNPKPLPVAKQ
jgi:cytochrome c